MEDLRADPYGLGHGRSARGDDHELPDIHVVCRASAAGSAASIPRRAGPITLITLPTAFCTPLPRYRDPPSLSSSASRSPVDAPLGTMARAAAPLSRMTSASTVGLPRESSTSRPKTSAISLMNPPLRQCGVRSGECG